ncbi:uncharacterized protein LOC116845502 [Odontomachus brunneus]|uniref:uncharacterized protein LOC116845502 n=1 Tax=Odontomachus brunneus TaxID=486640 RepID=UPI0013F2AA81|nr:uncharacterized protein LOC116845502 [Odontomachus brunneus]XP_032674163.1 uncharacterized protein LOC116845502 [Odontomachus brunneus]
MFYPAHLLSRRHRGKLAPCWLAATNSVNTFKKYYNTAAIKKINVTTTCEEILQAILLRNNKKFSLYLSSQLMYGVTRIFSYQVEYYQKELVDIWKIFNYTSKLDSEPSFNAVRALDTLPEIELPLRELKLLDRQMKEDLHILPDEMPDNAMKVLMQDATCLNFGVLTDEELDFMLEHDNDIALYMEQMMQITDDKHKSTEMRTDVEIAAEIHQEMHSPRISSSVLVDKLKITDKYKGKSAPSTPQKRQSRQPQVETPSKRRRISLENIKLPIADTAMDIAPIPQEDTPIPEQTLTHTMPVKDMEMMVFSQHMDLNMELESLHSSLNTFVVSRKKLVIDKRTVLTNTVLEKWRQNINFECREMEIPRIHKISSIDLLTRPSQYDTKSLRKLFVNHTKRPCKSVNKDTSIVEQYPEEVRGLQRTVDEYTGPMTSKVDLEQPSIEQSNIVPVQTTWVIDKPLHQETRADVDDANDTLEDIDIVLEKMKILSTSKDEISLPSTCSTDQCAFLTSQEIIAMLEVLWHDQPYVKFSQLVPKDTDLKQNAYTKQDAATVFCILLDLQSQKKLILNQREFYHTLWIQKYEDYSN